jgi:hypothetical protein
MPLPAVLAWTLGAVGAAALAKVLAKEWQRVNATLHAQDAAPAPVEKVVRESLPTLRRDPRTGVYRPD